MKKKVQKIITMKMKTKNNKLIKELLPGDILYGIKYDAMRLMVQHTAVTVEKVEETEEENSLKITVSRNGAKTSIRINGSSEVSVTDFSTDIQFLGTSQEAVFKKFSDYMSRLINALEEQKRPIEEKIEKLHLLRRQAYDEFLIPNYIDTIKNENKEIPNQ